MVLQPCLFLFLRTSRIVHLLYGHAVAFDAAGSSGSWFSMGLISLCGSAVSCGSSKTAYNEIVDRMWLIAFL